MVKISYNKVLYFYLFIYKNKVQLRRYIKFRMIKKINKISFIEINDDNYITNLKLVLLLYNGHDHY